MLEKYEQWLKVNGTSHNTITNYLPRVRDFLKDIEIEEITEDIIIQYLLKLQETLSPASVNGYKSAIRSFLRFLKKDISLPKNQKLKKRLPEYVTKEFFEDEIIPVVEDIFQNPLKVKAILYFMFYTGVRRSEIPMIERKNIDLLKRIAKIPAGKNKEEKLVIFPKKVKQILECYFIMEEEKKNAFNISSSGIRYIFDELKTYFKEINLHPHLFRHACGTYLREEGVPLADIKEQLGHKNIKTTMIYAHSNIKSRKKIFDEKVK